MTLVLIEKKHNKHFKLLIFLLCFSYVKDIKAQRLSKKEGRDIAQNAIQFLVKNDTSAFISMWYLNYFPTEYNDCVKDGDIPPYYEGTVIRTKIDAKKVFVSLKSFLDKTPADISSIRVKKLAVGYKTKYNVTYKISCYFKSDNNIKTISFYIGQTAKNWLFRLSPETSDK